MASHSNIKGASVEKQEAAPVKKLLLSVADVAAHLGVCRQTVYNYIYFERMPSIKVRGMRRVHPDSLSTWLKEREQVLA